MPRPALYGQIQRMPPEPPFVTVFTDFSSPFCHVTEAALRSIAEVRDVSIRYRAFELHPAPAPLPEIGDAAGWPPELQALASAEGLILNPRRSLPRTRKAHEAARFGASHGREPEMRLEIYRACWEEGADIGRIDVLASLATRVGLDPEDLRIALDIDRFSQEVERDLEVGRRLRIRAVPTLYVGTGPGARILVGAQSRAALDAAVHSR